MLQAKAIFLRQFYRTFCSKINTIPLKNDEIIPNIFRNRNPRNLERMRIAYKPIGYHLEVPGREFWHKLYLEEHNRSITAYIKHNSGKIVVSASSSESSINVYLYRNKDISAYTNIARVLAQRCLESGISEVACDFSNIEELQSEKLKTFVKTIQEEGLTLEEPSRYIHPRPWDNELPNKPWDNIE